MFFFQLRNNYVSFSFKSVYMYSLMQQWKAMCNDRLYEQLSITDQQWSIMLVLIQIKWLFLNYMYCFFFCLWYSKCIYVQFFLGMYLDKYMILKIIYGK